MKQTLAVDTMKHPRLVRCPSCKRRFPSLRELVCEDCFRKLNEVRKEVSELQTSEGRAAARSDEAPPRSEKTAKEDDRPYALSWFEMVCVGGGIAIWIGYLISDFYFWLTVTVVMVLAVIAMKLDAMAIR